MSLGGLPDGIEGECLHGMVGPCSICKEQEKRRTKQREGADPWQGEELEAKNLTAEYHGTCRAMQDHISPGDGIVKDGDGYSHWECV